MLSTLLWMSNNLDLSFSTFSIPGMFLQPPVTSELLITFCWFLLSKIQYKTSLVEADSGSSQHVLLLLLCHCPNWLTRVLTLLYSYGYHPCGSTRTSIWFSAWNFGHQPTFTFCCLCPLVSCWSFCSYTDEPCSDFEYPCSLTPVASEFWHHLPPYHIASISIFWAVFQIPAIAHV